MFKKNSKPVEPEPVVPSITLEALATALNLAGKGTIADLLAAASTNIGMLEVNASGFNADADGIQTTATEEHERIVREANEKLNAKLTEAGELRTRATELLVKAESGKAALAQLSIQ